MGAGARAGQPKIIPLLQQLLSANAPDFVSENTQQLRMIIMVARVQLSQLPRPFGAGQYQPQSGLKRS
jgi:hypothetical protein